MKHGWLFCLLVLGGLSPAWAQSLKEAPGGLSHTVEEGDTLWRLAETYLGDSGQWPAVWATNEHIDNPHWIFPGEVVFLSPSPPGGGEAKGALEPPGGPALPRLVGRPAGLPSMVAVDTLLTPGPVEGWGLLHSAITQSQMLSPLDEVHIQLKEDSPVRPGETFLIIRSQGKLRHPQTKKVLGYLTSVVGAAQLQWREGPHAMAKIVRANAEILRGDMLGPRGDNNLRPVYMRKNEKRMEGQVVAIEPWRASIAGGQHLVFVDKGSADGVAPGNHFHIIRQQDGLSLQTVLKPAVVHKGALPQTVGLCTLVDVQPNVSSCLLMWTSREIVPGDRVEMRE